MGGGVRSQFAGVFVLRLGEHGFAFAGFDHLAVFQHDDAVGEGADDGEVVADKDEAEAVPPL